MKFLFDNNLPPALAKVIQGLSTREPAVKQVAHLREKFEGNTPDSVWLSTLVKEGGWTVISMDRFKKSSAERQLISSQGITVFVLDPQWSSQQFWDQAARFVLWWPEILLVAQRTSGAAFRVPWKKTGQKTFQGI